MHKPCVMLSSAFDSRRFCTTKRRYQTPTDASAAMPRAASSNAWPATVDGTMDESMLAWVWYRAPILAMSDCDMVNVCFLTVVHEIAGNLHTATIHSGGVGSSRNA